MMKATRVHAFGGPEVLRFEEVPDPQPEAGEVLVRIHAAGVNPVETYIRSGIYGPKAFPYTPGTDAAGTIEQVGAGVTGLRVGDRVYTAGSVSGAYAEKATAPAARVLALPEKLSFEQGAALGVPYATAYRAIVQRGAARSGETVLIHGASGGVGTAAVQIARSLGLTVIGSGGTDAGRQLVREQGADHILNHTSPQYLDELKSITRGKGVDLIIEMLANVNLQKDLELLAPRGRVVVVGNRGKIEIDPRQTMSRDSDIRGMSLLNATDEEVRQIHAGLRTGLENGSLRPIIGKTFPLSDAAEAHRAVMASGAYGKIILKP